MRLPPRPRTGARIVLALMEMHLRGSGAGPLTRRSPHLMWSTQRSNGETGGHHSIEGCGSLVEVLACRGFLRGSGPRLREEDGHRGPELVNVDRVLRLVGGPP